MFAAFLLVEVCAGVNQSLSASESEDEDAVQPFNDRRPARTVIPSSKYCDMDYTVYEANTCQAADIETYEEDRKIFEGEK